MTGATLQFPRLKLLPEGLTRAALESCIGGPLYPGIETSYMTRDDYPFIEAFRLDATQSQTWRFD